jgi:asparagine synthetase B (glutamine-hydrolysing)
MCGIGLVLHACEVETVSSGGNEYVRQLKERMRQQLAYRGPDVQHEVTQQSQHTDARDDTTTVAEEVVSSYLWMFGSVLHIQGVLPAAQPFVDTSGECPFLDCHLTLPSYYVYSLPLY